MRPIRQATIKRELPAGIELDCGGGMLCRITLADAMARVLFLRSGGPPPGQELDGAAAGSGRHTVARTGPLGRNRLESAGVGPGRMAAWCCAAQGSAFASRSTRFRLEWLLPDGRVFLAERVGMAYMFGHRTHSLAHYVTRHAGDRFYGPR